MLTRLLALLSRQRRTAPSRPNSQRPRANGRGRSTTVSSSAGRCSRCSVSQSQSSEGQQGQGWKGEREAGRPLVSRCIYGRYMDIASPSVSTQGDKRHVARHRPRLHLKLRLAAGSSRRSRLALGPLHHAPDLDASPLEALLVLARLLGLAGGDDPAEEMVLEGRGVCQREAAERGRLGRGTTHSDRIGKAVAVFNDCSRGGKRGEMSARWPAC